MNVAGTLSDQAIAIARSRGIARARDFREAGVPPASIARLCEQGQLVRLARGLYQLADADEMDAAHSLAADYASESGIIHVADLKAPKPNKREETRFVRNDPPLRRN